PEKDCRAAYRDGFIINRSCPSAPHMVEKVDLRIIVKLKNKCPNADTQKDDDGCSPPVSHTPRSQQPADSITEKDSRQGINQPKSQSLDRKTSGNKCV